MLDLENDSRGKCPGRALGSVLLFVSSFLLLLCFLSKSYSALDPVWLDSIGLYQKVLWAGLIFVICLVSSLVSRLVCPGLSAVRDLGLKEEFPRALKGIGSGFLLGAFFVTAIISSLSLAGGYQFIGMAEAPQMVPYLLLYFISAVNEEMVFRGFLFQSLERGFGLKIAFVFASLLFGFAHMMNFIEGADVSQRVLLSAFLSVEAGFPMTMAFLLTRSIWFSVGIHFAWNFFEGVVYGANVSGHELDGVLVEARLTDGIWGGGGVLGPEATVVNLVFGLLLFCFLWKLKGKKFLN
ncbi:MAG: CPBP family intramembrane metalloprotease [Cyanobacteria bacterium HKST-UBA01]|nr:CPBP family intramembrane metalloprotease [Cyanobacteria bacterium HKST-UBA01]